MRTILQAKCCSTKSTLTNNERHLLNNASLSETKQSLHAQRRNTFDNAL